MQLLNRTTRRLARLKVGTRLLLAFGSVIALSVLLGAAAIVNLANVNRSAADLAGKWLPGVADTGAARAAVLEYREFEVKHAHAADASYMAEYEDKLKEIEARVVENLTAYGRLVTSAEERKLADKVNATWREYAAFSRKVMALGREGKGDDARDIGDGAAKVAVDETIAALDRLTAYDFAGGKQSANEAAAVYARARLWTLALVAASLLVGVMTALLISRSLRAQLGNEPDVAAAVVRAVAAGDLTTPIVLRAGDSDSLMAGLQHMQQSLAGVVSSVRTGSERVAVASQEIAQGNNDLSGRTEKQAAALQQTTSSMQELDSTVRQNADNAGEADALARSASDVASRGGEAVTRVVNTMRGINESSRRIADIVGTIDGIAFQTNILALNAAVEAARAGEHGRGFAVVASEVRSLAQRSANAAREIKGLIAASVERVEQGTAQVDEAGATMNEVVESISRVSAIVREISAASQAQSRGVAQVGEAVTEMDRTTQQNTALVEESAAAAESLREQSQELVRVVAAFRLKATAAA